MNPSITKANTKKVVSATAPTTKSVEKTTKKKTSDRTIAKRARALDEILQPGGTASSRVEQSAERSREAFGVLKKNASQGEEMAAQFVHLKRLGVLHDQSPAETESLLFPMPPSLHMRQALDGAAPGRIDCVLAMGEPELTGDGRRLLDLLPLFGSISYLTFC